MSCRGIVIGVRVYELWGVLSLEYVCMSCGWGGVGGLSLGYVCMSCGGIVIGVRVYELWVGWGGLYYAVYC